jgi:hypothetical protein
MPETQDTQEPQRRFGWGIDDVVILPLVVIGVAVKTLLRWAWRLLVHIVDFAFPIFLQVARFVLFTFRILGDAFSGLLRLIIKILPLPKMKQAAWREAVARGWSWIRRKISYKAFEEWLHHLFEDGMAWTFRTCRKLSPNGALLVILGAMVWVPVSFLAATAVHAWLIAEAANLPAWMQIFHGVATILAKSKLLMLPAYPAAWPQAKKQPIVAAGLRALRWIANLREVRKTIFRFGQVEGGMNRKAEAWGLLHVWDRALEAIARVLAAIGNGIRAVVRPVIRWLTKVPVIGPVVRTYESHYDKTGEEKPQKLSQRIRAFFDRWEIKFMPSYYEGKEREKEQAAKQASAAANDSA